MCRRFHIPKGYLTLTITSLMKRSVAAVLLIIAFVLQGTTSVLAGTTGSISGTVVDSTTNRPVAGIRITVTSPSQTASTTSDAAGHYNFLSLNPDTYQVSVDKSSAHAAYSVSGVTVQADNAQQVPLQLDPLLKTIGSVTSRRSSDLVRPGTTADVYSINAKQQDAASTLGGGGTLNSAFSAIASVPGVYVAPGQAGYIGAGATLSIRGGDYDQIGYELDGIPVNRSFDNYPSTSLSSLGQQEVQVYTGAEPANAEAEGISGYINQVIRTGTAPAYNQINLGIGAPTEYNKGSFETGGANPSRTFDYYLGLGTYGQNYRTVDQFDGASLQNLFGVPLAPCADANTAPSCGSAFGTDYTNGGTTPAYALGPTATDSLAHVDQRDIVANFHFGFPHKDGSKDSVQFLYDVSHISNYAFDSPNDLGGQDYLASIGAGPFTYVDALYNTTPYGTLLGSAYTGGGVVPYYAPYSNTNRALYSNVPSTDRDEFVNDQSIEKIQYQKNFGSNAYVRLYGYSYYSDWINNGGDSTIDQFYTGFDSIDYQLAGVSKGLSLQFSDQLNSKNLLSFEGSYTTANSYRFNNSYYGNQSGTYSGYLVSAANPGSGVCYTYGGVPVPGCNFAAHASGSGAAGTFGGFTLGQAQAGTVTPAPAGVTCGGSACDYLVVAGGASGSYNTVVPKFYSLSLTDDIRPTDKLDINLGMRYDLFQFLGADTTGSDARALFFNAYNITHPATPLANVPNQQFAYPEFQPRVGATYSVNPTTVLRASYGRYAQAPNTAFEQYNYLQPNSTGNLANFAALGLPNTPGHPVRPEVSNNYDFSLEKSFGRDTSIKLSPFLRQTQDQIQQFFLDQKTGFVSGLNVGRQKSEGFEFEADKGDFSRNGFAAKLSFAYTYSTIKYNALDNGSTVIDPINAALAQYNGFTKAGGGAPCYLGGVAAPGCPAGSVANPYYNANPTGLLDPNAAYPTFDTFPGGVGTVASTYGAPYVTTLIVQYKAGRFAVTPALQMQNGIKFGTPENTPGIDPTTCTGVLAGSTVGDPRYGNGAAGGSPYDATTCANSLVIPDPATGRFDGLGSFVEPSILSLHLQMTYDASKRVQLVANFANIYSKCFGGNVPAAIAVNGACGYGLTPGAGSGPEPIGNAYNPGDNIQPFLRNAYDPGFGATFPFNMYFEARIKL
jgi:hypothetical protein